VLWWQWGAGLRPDGLADLPEDWLAGDLMAAQRVLQSFWSLPP